MSDWHARLRSLVMAAPDPAIAARRWAAVLSGSAQDARVELGNGTSIVIVEGPEHGLVEIQLDATPQLTDAVARAGGEADAGSLVLQDPDGWTVRFTDVAEVAPTRLERATLSHCTFVSPDPMSQCDYWQTAGFRLTETIGDIFGWLRPNPIHHSLAFVAGRGAAIQHLAVELPDAGSLIAAVDSLVEAGEQVEFGPGRHIVGGNLFAYVLDGTGIRWELCAELERVSFDEAPKRHGEEMRGRSINSFGPGPPASFVERAGGPPPLGRARTAAR